MNHKPLSITLFLFALLISSLSIVHAAIITTSDLSYNDATNIITDTQSGTTYLDFNIVNQMSYDETVAATQIGGIYEDYHIATQDDAWAFFTAATTSLTVYDATLTYGFTDEAYHDGDFGTSSDSNVDEIWFLSSDFEGNSGLMRFYDNGSGHVFFTSYASILRTDLYAEQFRADGIPNGWLLVSDVSAVPVPAAVWLFSSGLVSLIGFARCKKA